MTPQQGQDSTNMKESLIKVSGTVTEIRRDANFVVKTHDHGHTILTRVSGKMNQNNIRISVGDSVDVEVSTYDLSKGRIVYRHK